MIKNNKKIKKIPLKNLSDARTLLTNLGKTAVTIGSPRLKPFTSAITGAKNFLTGSINAYKASKRVEQFKRSGQHSFQNLSQKEKLMQQSSPMKELEYNFPIRRPVMSDEGARAVIDRGEKIIGKKVFRQGKTSVGSGGETPSMNMTQMEQHMNKMNIGDLKKVGDFETGILKGRKPKIKG